MIITQKKKLDDILDSLEENKSVYLFGCDSCAEQCKTGGKEEMDEMTAALTDKGLKVTGASIVGETCYRQLILKEIRNNDAIKKSDAILVLACGAGVKTVADAVEDSQPVLPALDSSYLASVERVGRFFEGCSLCGECVLADTASICPHTDCSKGLLNGPCGGVVEGMCEVDIEKNCAWTQIHARLKAQDRLHLMRKHHPPKDYSTSRQPRKTLLRGEGSNL